MKNNNDVDYLREILIDYYGSATPFFPVAHTDVVRIDQMGDDEIIEAAEKLDLI